MALSCTGDFPSRRDPAIDRWVMHCRIAKAFGYRPDEVGDLPVGMVSDLYDYIVAENAAEHREKPASASDWITNGQE